eukprot:2992773-Lingulodinium_polyedra.AAC.1
MSLWTCGGQTGPNTQQPNTKQGATGPHNTFEHTPTISCVHHPLCLSARPHWELVERHACIGLSKAHSLVVKGEGVVGGTIYLAIS